MALNKLKKWIGTQLFETFMEEYNENVDATNAAIDLAETLFTARGNLPSMDLNDPFPEGVYNLLTANTYVNCPLAAGVLINLPTGVGSSGAQIAILGNNFNFRRATATGGYTDGGAAGWARVSSDYV